MKSAILAAENSYAKRSKVGAVLVKDGRIIASGWNGTPHGFPNECEKVLPDGTLETLPYVIHAEQNIIAFCARAGISTNGTEIYLTLSPCQKCAILLMQSGIRKVFYNMKYRDESGIDILNKFGIECKELTKGK